MSTTNSGAVLLIICIPNIHIGVLYNAYCRTVQDISWGGRTNGNDCGI